MKSVIQHTNEHSPIMNTQPTPQANSFFPNEMPRVLKRIPRFPRLERELPRQLSPFAVSVHALRLKSQQLILNAAKSGISQDTVLFEQITAEAAAYNTAAAWLASQAYPAGTQTGHPLTA